MRNVRKESLVNALLDNVSHIKDEVQKDEEGTVKDEQMTVLRMIKENVEAYFPKG